MSAVVAPAALAFTREQIVAIGRGSLFVTSDCISAIARQHGDLYKPPYWPEIDAELAYQRGRTVLDRSGADWTELVS